MDFKVNEVKFVNNLDFINNNNFIIKSFNKDYKVIFEDLSITNLLEIYYEKNDFIVIDRNVYNLDNYFFNNIDNNNYLIYDALEINKNIENVLNIIDKLNIINFTKTNKLIVIGGGITQDVSGFAASIYKRGIKWIYIPTTLLSITDSAIGAKVNINRGIKNNLGMFNAPDLVHISKCFLETLKEDDIISGIGEAYKLCLIGGTDSINYFYENYENNNLINIIKMSMIIKKNIIEYDEMEKNIRKVLNYGHTFGHAIESCTNYFIPHGISVLFGMYIINELFYKEKHKNINDFILKIIPDKFKNLKISYNDLLNNLKNDKKNIGDTVCFIILEEIGNSKITYNNINLLDNEIKKILSNIFII